jgi:hypothetical protein
MFHPPETVIDGKPTFAVLYLKGLGATEPLVVQPSSELSRGLETITVSTKTVQIG